jgi:hypothetical protein
MNRDWGASKVTLNFKSSGKLFPVKKRNLYAKLRLFQNNPSLLASDVYEVQTRVPVSIVEAFVEIIDSGEIDISEQNCESFRLLSEEFGFEALARECNAFAARQPHCREDTEVGALAERVNGLEEGLLEAERGSAVVAQTIRMFFGRFESLENEVRRLSDVCAGFEDRISALGRTVEAEQAYRRGCEYYCGTIGVNDEEMARMQGLLDLKRSADLGHVDGQYRYGRCLMYEMG